MALKLLPHGESLSKTNVAIITAFEKGYRVRSGKVVSPFSGKPLKLLLQDRRKYKRHRFSVSVEGKKENCYVHKLVAFQKYGYEIFKPGIEVRHLDGDSLNNLEDNIAIGTASENQMDKPTDMRQRTAIAAATKLRKFSDDQMVKIRELHKAGWTYKKLMKKFDISSTGTMSHIINNEYQTRV